MNLTKDECKNKVANQNNFDSFEKAIRYTFGRDLLFSEKQFLDKIINESMQVYAEQEARAYANWLANQVIAGRTAEKLFVDYKKQFGM